MRWKAVRTWVEDADTSLSVEDFLGEEGAPVWANEHALRKDRAKHHNPHDGRWEEDSSEGREDDATINSTKQDATLQVHIVPITVKACKGDKSADAYISLNNL